LGDVGKGSDGVAVGRPMEGWKKGMSYGTFIVDLERHRVIDLLADRTVASIAD
jgi:hypothetical protein